MRKLLQEESPAVFRNLDRIILGTLAVLLLLYIASGIYVVQANEVALLRRFGALRDEMINPGIHYRIPWPVDRVDKIKIKEVKRMEVGFSPELGDARYEALLPYCITGDKNIIHTHFAIQYRIEDAGKYLFTAKNPRTLLKEQANRAILDAVARMAVDPVLTTGKRELELDTQEAIRQEVDEIGLGISIVSIETKSIQPPRMVIDAFNDVITAREEKSTAIHEAENYRNRIIPQAKADANNLIEEAEAYKYQRVEAAKGESDRFAKLYEKARSAPEVTRDRLFLELVDEMLPRVKTYVLASDENGRPVRLKLIKGTMPTVPQLR
jgi:membrane protease subunit HflK